MVSMGGVYSVAVSGIEEVSPPIEVARTLPPFEKGGRGGIWIFGMPWTLPAW